MGRLRHLSEIGTRLSGLVPQRSIGLDIDQGALKAVQISGRGGDYTLQHVGYHRLPPGAILEGEVADHDLLAAHVREFWESHSFKGKNVVIGISNGRVIVRIIQFPRMEPEDLKSAIGFEAQDHIPMPLEEAVLDHVVLGPVGEGSDLDNVLIVAADREMVSRYASAVRAGGLRPVGVDVKALSLTRSTLPEDVFEDGSAVLLVDVGTEITNLVIVQEGMPTLARFLSVGFAAFVGTVSETSDLAEEDAEKHILSRRVGLGGPVEEAPGELESPAEGEVGEEAEGGMEAREGEDFDPALDYDVRRGLEEVAQELAEEMQRSIEYHYSQMGTREVSRVVVSGEGALIPGLEVYLGELLGIEGRRGNPVARVVANKSNVSDEQLRIMEPVLAVAFGLAMEDE